MKKICPTCKVEKELNEFRTDKRTRDGKYFECDKCRNKRQRERYASDPEIRRKKTEYVRRYRSDPDNLKAYKEYNTQYMRTPKGKEIQRISHKKYKEKHPGRIKAKSAVNNAIQRSGFPPISTQKCVRCNEQAEHYHHHSYEPEHWLDVEPLCIMCHRALHKEIGQSS